MKIKIEAVALFVFCLAGCTDTDRASIAASGMPGHITCYVADGVKILDEDSTGRIQTVQNSDGWEYKSAQTGKFTRVSGACVVRN